MGKSTSGGIVQTTYHTISIFSPSKTGFPPGMIPHLRNKQHDELEVPESAQQLRRPSLQTSFQRLARCVDFVGGVQIMC